MGQGKDAEDEVFSIQWLRCWDVRMTHGRNEEG